MKKVAKLTFGDFGESQVAIESEKRPAIVKELRAIARSLGVLESVVSSLVAGKKPVPYEDCVVTQFLKSSLSGNGDRNHTTLIVHASAHCVSAAQKTTPSLSFANRCQMILNDFGLKVAKGKVF